MHSHRKIIETYCQVDFEHRLSLFLSYPSLRNTFIQIDQGEYETKKALKQNSAMLKAGRNRIISWAIGLFKYF
jgi:hypothetical protein